MMVSSFHKSALERQVGEAVRIRRRGGAGHILSSKSEFNRCHIPRLVLEEEDEEAKKQRLAKEPQDKLEFIKGMDKNAEEWEMTKQRERDIKEK